MKERRRIISVPKDKIAQRSLEFDEATEAQLIEISITEEEFLFMYKNGIIELINHAGKSSIDDYEHADVTGKKNLGKVINVLGSRLKSDSHNQIIQTLHNLFNEAFLRDTGVYFFF